MIQYQLKSRMTKPQRLPILGNGTTSRSGRYNAMFKDKIYFSKQEFQKMPANHGERLGITSGIPEFVRRASINPWRTSTI